MPKKSTSERPPEYGAANGFAPRPSSDTFLEMAAEIIDPVEWVALQMTKLPVKPSMTRGEAMDLVKAIVREGFQMLKRQEAQTGLRPTSTSSRTGHMTTIATSPGRNLELTRNASASSAPAPVAGPTGDA